MILFLLIALFVLCTIVLVKSSDLFTDAAEKVGKHFKMPAFIIGVTIVAIGTSLPELISSIVAVMEGSSEMVVANVMGSNITNIFLVLGVAAIIRKKAKISHELIHVDLPLLMGSAFLLVIMAWDGQVTAGEGILLLLGIVIYLTYTASIERKSKDAEAEKVVAKLGTQKKLSPRIWIVLVVSAAFVYLGAKYVVFSVIEISEIVGIGADIIAASAVALGTSLPELMVSVSAARKGNSEIAVGNILGSNIFNALAVTGIAGLFGTLVVSKEILYFTMPVMIVATVLYYFITEDKQLTMWEGLMLLLFYIAFLGKLFGLI